MLIHLERSCRSDCLSHPLTPGQPFSAAPLAERYYQTDASLCNWDLKSRWTGQHSRHHSWSTACQGSSVEWFKELSAEWFKDLSAEWFKALSEHAPTWASLRGSPEGKRDRERKRPMLYFQRQGTICVQPDKHWHCLKATLVRLWRDGIEREWAFPSTTMSF